MSLPYVFSLSNELLIEIISNLRPGDIYACRCTCRKLNGVIINSHLIQYIMRTALSGVFDLLEPGLSLPDRLDSLEQWETAWMEMDLREPKAIIDPPVFIDTATPGGTIPGHGILSGRYFIMCNNLKRIGSAFYYFLDTHAMSSHSNAAHWTTIQIDNPTSAFAFSPELDLTVAISVPTYIDELNVSVAISPLQFSTGEPHPLASQPKLEISLHDPSTFDLSMMDMTVIGDYALYWIADRVESSLRCIYLVAWKEGWISEVFTSHPGLHSSDLSVLSEEMILLVRLREPALELCRLSNINDREKASLETARILYLPTLTTSTLLWAGFDKHPPSSSSSLPEGSTDTRRHLHSVPMDGIVVMRMHLRQPTTMSHGFELIVRRRTLLDFASAQAQAGVEGTGTSPGLGTVHEVPWEKWGPNKTRILEHDSFIMWRRSGSVAGERRATVHQRCIKIRDYNPYRVGRALALLGGAGRGVTLENGSVIKVFKGPSVCRAGVWFCEEVETSLPYVETATSYDSCCEVLLDDYNLMVEQTVPSEFPDMKFHLHYF